MKTRLMIFLLASAVAAFAQHGAGGGHGSMGGSGMGGGMGSSHASAGGMGSGNGMGNSGNMGRSANAGSQSGKQMDTILSRNTGLSKNLTKLLPEGTTPQQACGGFKNLGQCVAAIHVSHNLNIPFADLKAKMTGTTSENVKTASAPESLGKAIHELKPDANAKQETKKGQKQANQDLNATAS